MTEAVFAAEPVRLIISAIAGIAILLILILKCKLHPVLSLLYASRQSSMRSRQATVHRLT